MSASRAQITVERVSHTYRPARGRDVLALDEETRSLMQAELYAIWQRTPKTVVFVTHDVQEAVRLAQRVLVMSARPGRIKAIVDIHLDRADPHLYRSSAFAEKVDEIWSLVRDEAIKAQ